MQGPRRTVTCEICGREVPEVSVFRVFVEGSMMVICPSCYARYVSRRPREEAQRPSPQQAQPRTALQRPAGMSTQRPLSSTGRRPSTTLSPRLMERYEVDPSYPEIIRRGREAKGMTTRDLAQRLGESENVIKRIEAGRLTPSIELAKKIEEVLGVKILVARVEETEKTGQTPARAPERDLTLGDLVVVRKRD